MGNLIRMDLYRMRKARSFWVCLILTFVFGLASTPLEKLLYSLGSMLQTEGITPFPETANLSDFLASPLSGLGIMLSMLSICAFFYADAENGYIKNIAGQMPEKGYTILSKFITAAPHNLLFMIAGMAGNLLGTVLFRRIIADPAAADGIRVFFLKLLLLQSISAIFLFVVAALQIKSLGTVLAVLFGLGLLTLVYLGIDAGLQQLFPKIGFKFGDYMPDQVLGEAKPDTVKALAVALVTGGIFLPLAIRIFDKRDVK